MARIEDIPQPTRDAIVGLAMPALDGEPWVQPKPLARSRVAILTSAALHRRMERPFEAGTPEFRELPSSLAPADMLMSHISINFDRIAFERDINVAYPIDRLRELAAAGHIGSVATTHYSVIAVAQDRPSAGRRDGPTGERRKTVSCSALWDVSPEAVEHWGGIDERKAHERTKADRRLHRRTS